MVFKSNNKNKISNKIIKLLLFIAGTIFLGVGVIGILLPIIPTTPFLLLAAACYIRSSKKLYDWLINNKWLGNFIKDYIEGKGVSLKFKFFMISVLWITILLSVFVFINILLIKVILIFIAFGVTIHILMIKPYRKIF